MSVLAVLDPAVHLLYVVLLPALSHVPAVLLIVGLTLVVRLAIHPLMRRPGCLTALVQAPVVAVVYRVFTTPVIAGQHNLLLDQTMLGAPMSGHLLALGWPGVLVFVLLLTAIAGVAWLTWLDAQRHPAPLSMPEGQPEQVAQAAQRMQRLAPYLSFGTVAVAVFLPLAAAVYLLTTNTWTLLERRQLRVRLG